MAQTYTLENQPDMTYEEVSAWFDQWMPQGFKPNQATYVLWQDGLFMGEGHFYHKSQGVYKYSHTVDYEDPQVMADNRVSEVSTENLAPDHYDGTAEDMQAEIDAAEAP